MKMDFQIPFIFVSLFSLASVLLVFIYKFGIKEKSYEEALAEQRQQTHLLFGMKSKSKDKKSKKVFKKGKEKVTPESDVVEDQVPVETVQPEVQAENDKNIHVEFKPTSTDDKILPSKKQSKKEKLRSILVHKEKGEPEVIIKDENPVVPSNNFEEVHPKDELELLKLAEDVTKEESDKRPTQKTTKVEAEVYKQPIKKQPEVVPPVPQKENVPVVTASLNGFVGNVGKEKKKKKSEFNTLQQLVGDSNGPNMSVLLNLVRKAELSRSEVQILTDLLLNKQHEAPAVLEDWSEGKADPVQKLKKQLAEKEKMLLEVQEVVTSAQSKLKEIRSEHQGEKSVLQQKIRNLEEMYQGKQLETSRLLQQLQQLQAQFKEESLKNQKLREEQAAIQMQRQQIEIRLAQAQESEIVINQLRNDIQELNSQNGRLRVELQHITEEYGGENENHKAVIVQLTAELEQLTEHNRRLDENRHDLKHKLEELLNEENNLQTKISELNSIKRQQNEEIRRLQKSKNDSDSAIFELKSEVVVLTTENEELMNAQMHGSLLERTQHELESEIYDLNNELGFLKTTLTQRELQATTELEASKATIQKLQQNINELEKQLDDEKSQLETQRIKNNDLRTKNWKVMEALNAAESKLKTTAANTCSKSDVDIQKEFIQRLFPEIKELQSANSDVFQINSSKNIRKYIDDLQRENKDAEVQQLKSKLQHYRNVIDDAERMLNKLQQHIEQEEIKWRVQLAGKAAELESLKQCHALELTKLETKLQRQVKQQVHLEGGKNGPPTGLSIETQNYDCPDGLQ